MKILMVCLGNICRSPLAEGIMKTLVKENDLDWLIDSAGTSGWHEGEKPDRRSIEVAMRNKINITNQRSRKIESSDLNDYDHILVMDSQNYQNVLRLCNTENEKNKVELLLNFSNPGMNYAVPDPYYDGGFDGVFLMIKEACTRFIERYKP